MIKKESIENLKNHLDVVDVISQFLELKKTGANFKACCPFHGETTPSFVVSPAKQIYHCFGCGVGGDSIKFVMEYEKLSYPETIEKLASMYNFNLDYENSTEVKQDTKILEEVNKYYQKLFVNNDVVKEYIHKRGISEFSIEKFEIGYAPISADTINHALDSNTTNTVGILTNDFHMFRAMQIARAQKIPNAYGISCGSTKVYLPNNMFREYFAEIKFLLKQFTKHFQ